ncbi:Probable integral membrane protein Cj1452 [hydrothermal vent metagenome]|uniref:Probable integral membrane protein Cj1452 n=1 Tax=hydrothermal vent metagenome TaxID=652676 RepID=A0A3B1E5Y6_9ZZZZ
MYPISQFNIIILSIKDMTTSHMLKIVFLPFLITLIILYALFFLVVDIEFFTQSKGFLEDLSLKYSFISIFLGTFIHAIGIYILFWVSLFVSVVVVGFMTAYILKYLQIKYYPNVKFSYENNILSSIYIVIKTILIMIILFIILIPFYFIPVINIIIIHVPFYYFFHKILHFDVGSTLMNYSELQTFKIKNKFSLEMQSVFLYLLAMIPFISLILPVFFIIYLGHNYMYKINKDHEIKLSI